MTGEERRKWLQRIRRRIAEYNDIVYMQSEQHEKDCAGDCKVCQAEARYIDSELTRKAKLGGDVKLSSILSEVFNEKSPDENSLPNNDQKTVSKGKNAISIDELELTIHLDSAVRRYGISNTDELYSMLKNDPVNMKKKLRGGYRYLVERLMELGYKITDEMR